MMQRCSADLKKVKDPIKELMTKISTAGINELADLTCKIGRSELEYSEKCKLYDLIKDRQISLNQNQESVMVEYSEGDYE